MYKLSTFLQVVIAATTFLILFHVVHAAPAPSALRPQQLVFISPGKLASGMAVGIFLPAVPVTLGLQSKSGSRVLTVGELLNCRPYEEDTEMFKKDANGDLQPFTSHQSLLDCGAPTAGGTDRIFAIAGIRWSSKE